MTDSFVTKNQGTRHPASGAGVRNSVGCLPLLLVWFLVDLIGTACHAGGAQLVATGEAVAQERAPPVRTVVGRTARSARIGESSTGLAGVV